MSLSEFTNPGQLGNPGQSRLLDEVRAKIFYLASDVELASQPAAMLLRAVAESIVDSSEAPQSINGHATLNGMAASLLYSRANEIRSPGHRVRDAVLPPAQHAAAASSRSGHKR